MFAISMSFKNEELVPLAIKTVSLLRPHTFGLAQRISMTLFLTTKTDLHSILN